MNSGVALKLGLSIIFAFVLIFLVNQFAAAISFQKITLPNKAVRIQSLNNPLIDIQLLENTDQCLVDCYSILKIHTYQPFSISQSDSIQFLKSKPEHKGISSYSFELLETGPYTATIPTYTTISYKCTKDLGNNSIVEDICARLEQNGSRIETRYNNIWKPIDFFSFTFEPNKNYIIRLSGKKYPTLGENNIDWLLTLKGITLTEFAWWNSSWLYRRQITITNNNNTDSIPNAFTINFSLNLSELSNQGKIKITADDMRIVFNGTQELDRIITDVGTAVKFDNSQIFVPDSPSLDSNVHKLTIEAWIKPTAIGSKRIVTKWGDADVTNRSYRLTLDDGSLCGFQGVAFLIRNSTGTEFYICGQTSLNNSPHHVAGVYNSTNLLIFLDGNLLNISQATGKINNGIVGLSISKEKESFSGSIDEVRISNTSRYLSNFTPPGIHKSDSFTLLLFHFDEGGGATAQDSSQYNNTGSLQGPTIYVQSGVIPNALKNNTLFFQTQQAIPPATTVVNYHVYYGNPSAGLAPANGTNVFLDYCSFEDFCGWTLIGGGWAISDNLLKHFGGGGRPFAFSPVNITESDTAYYIEAKVDTGPLQIGAISRVQDQNNFYDNLIETESVTSLYKRVGGAFTNLATVSGTFERGRFYALKTILRESNIFTTVDDQFYLNATDSTFTSGFYGVDGYDPATSAAFRNFRISKFFQPGPTTSAGLESINGSLQVTDLIPIQVIKDVDLVQGKRTLVRVTVKHNDISTNQNSINVKLFFNNANIENQTKIVVGTQPQDFDFFFSPNIAGQNLNITAIAEWSVGGDNFVASRTKFVNVTRTRELNVSFISVNYITMFFPTTFSGYPENFEITGKNNSKFINKTYPLGDDRFITNLETTTRVGLRVEREGYIDFFIPTLLKEIHRAGELTGIHPERTVAIVKKGFFGNLSFLSEKAKGISIEHLRGVIIEDNFNLAQVAAHELAHTYKICDEYRKAAWNDNNKGTKCPNGDNEPPFGELDDQCIGFGCPTSTLDLLPDKFNKTMYNFMGNSSNPFPWISDVTFDILLQNFSHFSPIFTGNRVLISGSYNRSSITGKFDNFYTLGQGLADNTSEIEAGEYYLQIFDNQSNQILNLSFSMTFVILGDNVTEINESAFVFTLPYTTNMSRFVFKVNNTVLDEFNISNNPPTVTLLTPNGGVTFNNEIINISWNASDQDGNNLSYTILVSKDNGTTFDTFVIDHPNNSLITNSLDFADSKQYIVKIIATDGINTAHDTSDKTFEIDNDFNITKFDVVYSNYTERIFKIQLNNTLNQTIQNIFWRLNTSDGIKNSQFPFSLNFNEQIFMYLYHNFLSFGNFSISIEISTNNKKETDIIKVLI